MDSGSTADWVAGIGSILGTTVIGFGLLWEVHQRRKADAALAAEKRDAQAADARLVSAIWRIDSTGALVTVRNDAVGPIKGIQFSLRLPGANGVPEVLTPDRQQTPSLSLLGGHDEQNARLFYKGPEPFPSIDQIDPIMEFTDARGLRWRLVNDNQPERIFDAQELSPSTSDTSVWFITWGAIALATLSGVLAILAIVLK